MCVDDCENLEDLEKMLKLMHVQYNSDDSFDYVEDYVERTELSIEDEDETSIFKVDNRVSGEEFLEDLRGQIFENCDPKDKDEKQARPELKFRGYRMDYSREEMKKMYMSNVFLSKSTLLIVKNPKKQPFKLKPQQLGLQDSPELCENCRELKVLTIECLCSKTFYCSLGCRIKDMPYHRRTCVLADKIENLLEIPETFEAWEEPPFDYGLFNMGNTCYLNSVFNIIRHYPPFYSYIRSIDSAKMKETNLADLNIFPYLYDAFMRMNFQQREAAFGPFLLKACIGLKNETVVSP